MRLRKLIQSLIDTVEAYTDPYHTGVKTPGGYFFDELEMTEETDSDGERLRFGGDQRYEMLTQVRDTPKAFYSEPLTGCGEGDLMYHVYAGRSRELVAVVWFEWEAE